MVESLCGCSSVYIDHIGIMVAPSARGLESQNTQINLQKIVKKNLVAAKMKQEVPEYAEMLYIYSNNELTLQVLFLFNINYAK